MSSTANELLYDATIRHQIKLLRYSNGQADAVSKLLKAADAELVAKLQTDLTEASEARLKALLADIRKQRQALAESIGEEIKKDAAELAENEANWEVEAIAASVPVELKLNVVAVSTLKALSGRPINGVPLEGWLGSMAAGDINRIEQQLRLGVSQGETLDQLVRRIRGTKAANYEDGITSITRRNAQMIARTAANHISNAARQEVWNANADIISGVRWVATLDGRTSDVCRGRDGQVYEINLGPRPPAHPGCRSTITPVLDGERIVGDRPTVRDTRTRAAREVDFRADAKAKAGENWKGMSKAQRDDAIRAERKKWTGENVGQVPSSQTYDSWLRKQPKEFQTEVLGRAKAELFRNGLTLDKFIDEKGKPYTIAQLKAATSQDKLNVIQPGVGMKAKALLQQGLSNNEILSQIKKEYPDANTTAASLASYKTELKKAGALDQLVGHLPSGGVKQAQAVADVVANLEMGLPPGVKHAIGGQWANVMEDLDGVPGAYGYYEAGKGVLLSGKKLSAVSQQQAQQVVAHELGHLLHKQHEVTLNANGKEILAQLSSTLGANEKKLYGYYLSHMDELTAEIFAQALSPSPLTSQGLSAIEFNKAFEPAILAAKQKFLDKFPVPHPQAPAPLMGAPSVPFEVAGKHTTVGGLAKALLQQGLPDDQVLASVLAEFPTAKTSKASLASYKVELKKAGLLPNKASGPTVTAKAVPGIAPVPPMPKPAAAPKKSAPGLPLPALAGKSLGATSTKALFQVKNLFANGGSLEEAKALLASVFGTYQEPGGSQMIELAKYELATGKAAAKPYLQPIHPGFTYESQQAAAQMQAEQKAKAVDLAPARPAASPREGIPPPPRFTQQQRRYALEVIAGKVESSKLAAMNAIQKARGLPELTAEEAGAIRSYTGGIYGTLNNALRAGKYTSDLRLQAYVEAAQHGLEKMPKFQGLTSRGMTLHGQALENMLKAYQPGTIFEEAAFISTSEGAKAAFGGNVFIRIHGKRGVDISQFSKYPGEREVLYMPGTQLRVLKVEKSPSGTYVVDMEEV
jgi:SPP1 gp7 family putative phage head morphogenesis protein